MMNKEILMKILHNQEKLNGKLNKIIEKLNENDEDSYEDAVARVDRGIKDLKNIVI